MSNWTHIYLELALQTCYIDTNISGAELTNTLVQNKGKIQPRTDYQGPEGK